MRSRGRGLALLLGLLTAGCGPVAEAAAPRGDEPVDLYVEIHGKPLGSSSSTSDPRFTVARRDLQVDRRTGVLVDDLFLHVKLDRQGEHTLHLTFLGTFRSSPEEEAAGVVTLHTTETFRVVGPSPALRLELSWDEAQPVDRRLSVRFKRQGVELLRGTPPAVTPLVTLPAVEAARDEVAHDVDVEARATHRINDTGRKEHCLFDVRRSLDALHEAVAIAAVTGGADGPGAGDPAAEASRLVRSAKDCYSLRD